MSKALHELLSESIDYAGLSGIAPLPMREALLEFVTHHQSGIKKLVSHFVMPHHQLKELAKFSDRRDRIDGPLNLCIVGPEVENLQQFKSVVLNIEKDILAVHSGFPGESRTNILELMLPRTSVENLNPEELVKALEAVVITSANSRLLPHRVFFEIPKDTFDVLLAKKIIKVIALHNKSILKRKIDNYLFSGFKLNCGNVEIGNMPSSEYLAEILLYARDANVAVKFGGDVAVTLPKFDYNTNLNQHGFLNIFMAGILAYTQDLNVEEAIEVLDEKNPDNFLLRDGYVAWRELAAPTMEIKMLRMLSITSMNVRKVDGALGFLKDQFI